MSETARLDWAAAKARLARVEEILERGAASSEEVRERVYRQRAKVLAQPLPQDDETAVDTIMVFRLGTASYAFPLTDVVEVVSDVKCTPAPRAPAIVDGIIQVRGEIRPVFNLKAILGLPNEPATTILLLRSGSHEYGCSVDAVEDVLVIPRAERRAAGPSSAPHTLWLTADLVVVLDAASVTEACMEDLSSK